jgi:hypothetical protein
MSVAAGRSMIAGPGYHVGARGFESTEGYAIAGGNDVVRMYADGPASQWSATGDMIQWTGQSGEVRIARGFERTLAFEQYQPIELKPLTHSDRLSPWSIDDIKQRAEAAEDAARAVFEALGDQATS